MKCITLILVLTVLAGCYRAPDINSMKANFVSEKKSFEELNSLIKEDTAEEQCFAVGYENIGNFWKTTDGLWYKSGEPSRKISIKTVLEEVGIPEERYARYVKLFKSTGSQEISHCREIEWSRIIMSAGGLGVSGCLTSININGNLNIPKSDIAESYSSEITPIIEGWYINHDCT